MNILFILKTNLIHLMNNEKKKIIYIFYIYIVHAASVYVQYPYTGCAFDTLLINSRRELLLADSTLYLYQYYNKKSFRVKNSSLIVAFIHLEILGHKTHLLMGNQNG